MKTIKFLLFSLMIFSAGASGFAQAVISKEEMLSLTPLWTGERFADGRPKVSDALLKRLKLVTHEEAWAFMRGKGYAYQFAEGNWEQINPDSVLVGRAVTATFMPGRPDIWKAIDDKGKAEGRRAQNVWAVELLVKGDVYVADQFGAHFDGPTVGDRVAADIYRRTGNGMIYDGALRDIAGLKEFGGFTSYFTSYHPSYHNPNRNALNTMIVGVNRPTRIRNVTVMAGDAVLGRDGAIAFIPPHLLEDVIKDSEKTRLTDMFAHLRTKEGKYTAGQMDAGWTAEINKDYTEWLNANINKLPVPKEMIQEILNTRSQTPTTGSGLGPQGGPGPRQGGPGAPPQR
jgi:regulator of RNase E activity RraA